MGPLSISTRVHGMPLARLPNVPTLAASFLACFEAASHLHSPFSSPCRHFLIVCVHAVRLEAVLSSLHVAVGPSKIWRDGDNAAPERDVRCAGCDASLDQGVVVDGWLVGPDSFRLKCDIDRTVKHLQVLINRQEGLTTPQLRALSN